MMKRQEATPEKLSQLSHQQQHREFSVIMAWGWGTWQGLGLSEILLLHESPSKVKRKEEWSYLSPPPLSHISHVHLKSADSGVGKHSLHSWHHHTYVGWGGIPKPPPHSTIHKGIYQAVTLSAMIYYSEKITNQNQQREKAHGTKTGRSQAHVFMSPLPFGSHRTCLTPPAKRCDICEMLSTREIIRDTEPRISFEACTKHHILWREASGQCSP